jgi:hypothetical protein
MLPLLLVQAKVDSNLRVHMSEDRTSAMIESDEKFNTLNENHAFAALGLSDTNEEDISYVFSPELTAYL